MFTHAAKALPWSRYLLATAVIVMLLEVVRRWPYTMWPLEACAVGLFAGACAWCLDEPAAAVVDAAPRSLRWCTAARVLGTAPLAAAWLLAVWWAREGLFGHGADVALQGLGAAGLAIGLAAWARSGGSATPGRLLVSVIVPVATFIGLARPWTKNLPLFPYGPGDDWASSRGLWLGMLGAGLALTWAALADVRWQSIRRRKTVDRVPARSRR